MGVASYIKDIKDTVTSVFEGMTITFSHLVRRPMTIQYPDKIPVPIQETLPRRYRGILEVDMDICTGCLACERDCPITCITIGIEMDKETKQRNFTHFDIDICKCMYCGLCSEACPTGADPPLSGIRRGELQSGGVGAPFCDCNRNRSINQRRAGRQIRSWRRKSTPG